MVLLLKPRNDVPMNPKIIASAMIEVTKNVMWEPRLAWMSSKVTNPTLSLRVGSGESTHVSTRSDKPGLFVLTYGAGMVKSKMDPTLMAHWLTSKEIVERGYFNGELNLLNCLTHTIIHEFSHVIQLATSKRRPGSVHNREFYAICDLAHANGHADVVRGALDAALRPLSYDLSSIQPANLPSQLSAETVHIGQTYYLSKKNTKVSGPLVVVSKARTRALVRTTNGCRYHVHFTSLQKEPTS